MRNIYNLIASVAAFGNNQNLALSIYKDFDETGDADTDSAWIAKITLQDGWMTKTLEGIELYAEADGELLTPEIALQELDALCVRVLEIRNA